MVMHDKAVSERDPRPDHPARTAARRELTALRFARTLACAAALALAGCTYYGYPAAGVTPASFDRSFDAAAGAIRDQGMAVSVEDRSNGTIVGRLGAGAAVTATVRQQADGSVRVQFDATGARDPALIDRVSRAYDARMGR